MKENFTLVRQIVKKLDEIGWVADLYKDPRGYWTCKMWRKDRPDSAGSAAGTTRLSAIHATLLDVISKI